jgi:hypothetical protein
VKNVKNCFVNRKNEKLGKKQVWGVDERLAEVVFFVLHTEVNAKKPNYFVFETSINQSCGYSWTEAK